jgi:aspartyl-tRNA(Asn)/glutamyl-tRNA(Gln) amidotransferase subunit B
MANYEPVIGLEVHVELNTKSKMFCKCSANYFGEDPNTHTCPVCLGLPGALPVINEEVIRKCIQIGLALNCSINEKAYFERKNYFYPDLAKGFQTSQLVLPVCVQGWIMVEGADGKETKIRINRAHQEEDTGKLTHAGSETLIDFNRSSVPLTEIVTEPDFTDTAQIRDYAKKLQQIFRYLGVSNADMERGDMRLEANVSVRKVGGPGSEDGEKKLPPYRVELKNINSFRFMVAAVEYEIRRQIAAHEAGEALHQETRGWNEDKRETFLQRSKEEANDYRYFPEPDLPEMHISEEKVSEIREILPELPWQKIERYQKDFGLSKQLASQIAESRQLAEYFEKAVEYGSKKKIEAVASAKTIANQIINNPMDIVGGSFEQIVDDLVAKKSNMVSDVAEIEKWCKEAIKEEPDAAQKYRDGKIMVIGVLVGLVMRKSQGKAEPGMVRQTLEKLLA